MKAVLNPDTNEVLGFDDNMSDDAIGKAIQSDKDGRPQADVNPTPYDVMVRPALEQAKLTGNNQILYDARRRAADADPFNRALMHGLSFGLAPDLNPEEKKAYGTEDTLGNLAGQTGSILATAGLGSLVGVGKLAAVAGTAAKGLLPAAAAATEVGSGALLPVTAGEAVANTAAAVTSSASLGAMYNGITESVNQGKIFASDHKAPDVAKIGESILHGAVSWAPYGVGGAFMADAAPGLASGAAATAGAAYVVSKAEGQSEPDARLNSILMGMFHFVSHVGTPGTPKIEPTEDLKTPDNIVKDDQGKPLTIGMTPEQRQGVVEDLQNTMADYTKAKNGMTESGNLHQMVGDELVKEEAQAAINQANEEFLAKYPQPQLISIGGKDFTPDQLAEFNKSNPQADLQARVEAEKKSNQPEIQQQFKDPYQPEMLDYLAKYIAPKEVARMSGDQRLALANAPWQELREVSEKFDRGEIGELKDFFAAKIKNDATLARTQDNTFKEVTSSDTLTKALVGNVTKKVIAAQEPAKTTGPEGSPEGSGAASKAPANVVVPTFKNTEEALKFGEANKNNASVQAELGRLYDESRKKSTALIASDKDEDLQAGMDEAVRGQFFREAKESAEGKIKPIVPRETKSTDNAQPVDKSGKQESGLSQSVESSAIHKGLIEDLGDLPSYEKRDMADIAKKVEAFIAKDPALAKKIALGESPEQDGLRAQELFTGLRVKAEKSGDSNMIRDLALSDKAAAMAAEAGQRVKAYDAGGEDSPVKAIREVKKAREEAAGKKTSEKDLKKETEATVKEIKKSIKKAAPKEEDWNDFLESIRC